MAECQMRVGLGYDIHRLVEGRDLILGGLKIPFDRGLLGHSDADAVLHAVTDAVLGALGLGDIGEHFPDNDPRWKGADSRKLLAAAVSMAKDRGFCVVNVDLNVVAEAPKLKPHKEPMRRSIAELLGIPADRVSVKAKTREGLDAVGRIEAIEVHCVALLAQNSRT